MSNVVMTTNPAPVVYTNQVQPVYVQPPPHPAQKYAKIFLGLGITQVVIGVLCIIFAIVALALNGNSYYYSPYSSYYYYGTTRVYSSLTLTGAGIWAGSFALTAGILGIVSGKNVNSCKVTGSMIMAIFAAITAGVMFALETPAAVYLKPYTYISQFGAIYAMHVMMAILAFVELIVSIVHSAYCCTGGCCASTTGRVLVRNSNAPLTYRLTDVFVLLYLKRKCFAKMTTHYGIQVFYVVIQYNPLMFHQPPSRTIVTTTTAYPNQMPVSNIPGTPYGQQPNQNFVTQEQVAMYNQQYQAPAQQKQNVQASSQYVGQQKQQQQPPQYTEKRPY